MAAITGEAAVGPGPVRSRSSSESSESSEFSESGDVADALARLGVVPLVGGVDVPPFAGRNDNAAGRDGDGREVFVKRLTGEVSGARERYDRALAFERVVSRVRPRGWGAPSFVGGDRGAPLLVHEYVAGAVAGHTLADEGRFDAALARRAGRALGELHAFAHEGVPRRTADRQGLRSRFAALELDEYTDSSAAVLQAWALLHRDDALPEALRRASGLSAAAPLVPSHGDLRLDQFLLAGDGRLLLCDWEEFRLADPAVDVGGFVGQWLYRAAARMFTELDPWSPDAGADAHGALVRGGEEQLAAVRPLVAAFWAGYREHGGDAGLAVRATAYAGWHLFDRMFAAAAHSPRLTAVQRGTAGVGRGALLAPERFAEVVGLVDVPGVPVGGRS